MKKNIFPFTVVLFLLAGLLACDKEDERGLPIPDATPPGAVSEIIVTNLPGGAKIEYKIPRDEDVSYVEASYQLGSGRTVTTKSSIYKNYVIIEGLRKAESQKITLVTVDKSTNRSVPVVATISPETTPIDKLFASFELVQDFGGVRIKYNNEDNIKAELLLYVADKSGRLVYNRSTFISNNEQSSFTFRGFSPELTTFGISAIDRWDNTTGTLKAEILPLEESLLSIEDFKDVFLTGDAKDAFGWVKSNLWNGSINEPGFHTAQDNPGIIVPPYTEPYHMFTVDLGVKAKLSRFKWWQRQGSYIFAHGNPRYFEVWGIDKIPADNGASLNGWTKLLENGEVVKPSGGPLGKNSAEDAAQAASGEQFNLAFDAPSVRYIRFVNRENWTGGKFMHFMELNFFGKKDK